VSSGGAESLKLYISEQGFGLAHEEKPATWQVIEAGKLDAAVLLAAAGRTRRSWRRERLEVQVSGAMARPFLMASVEGLRDRTELERVALRQGALATGLEAAGGLGGWNDPALWLEPAPRIASTRVGAVLAAGLREIIVDFAAQARFRLVSIRPWWVQVLNSDPTRRAAVGVVAARDEDSVTLLASHGGAWRAAEAYTPCPNGAQVEAAVRRLELSLGDARGGTLRMGLATDVAHTKSAGWPVPQPLDTFA
jgi:hypothetical protein